jgi:hypothetical protein
MISYLWLTESPRHFSAALPARSLSPPRRRASPHPPLAFSVFLCAYMEENERQVSATTPRDFILKHNIIKADEKTTMKMMFFITTKTKKVEENEY